MNMKPAHMAFIMDGNRRWAKEQGVFKTKGHIQGRDTAEQVITWCREQEIPHVTLWALSTDNWKKREKIETDIFFQLIADIPKHFSKMQENQVSLDFIGDIAGLPKQVQQTIAQVEKEMYVENPVTKVHLAVNYGGRRELLQAIEACGSDITEECISHHLYTSDIPDVEVIVRTGGDTRLSGFMLWQCEYAELYFTDTLWPSYSKNEFISHLERYQETRKNFGA